MLAEYCSSVYTTSLCPLRAAKISGVDPFSSLQSTSTWADSVFVWMSSGDAVGPSGLSGSVKVSPMGSRLRRPMLSSRRSFESRRLRRDRPLRSCCGGWKKREKREVEGGEERLRKVVRRRRERRKEKENQELKEEYPVSASLVPRPHLRERGSGDIRLIPQASLTFITFRREIFLRQSHCRKDNL